ncbi:Protein maternal effect lethal [Ooceraea biroi]|nr:Protein maternal effect lethal [Ooceraea biroi]
MVYKSMPVIQSSAISKPLWCKIEMRLCQAVADKSEDTIIKFHILLYTEEAYHGVWDISAIYLDEKRLCASTGGYVTNNSCLYETTAQTLLQYLEEDRLTLNFTITVARDMLNETLHSIPLRTNRINETEDYRNLIINKANLYSSQIIFKKDYGTDNYIFKISKGLLQSTRSTYFTKLCNMHRRDEDQDSTVILDDESDIFVIMLTFIKTGSLPESVSSNYDTLTKLLRAAHKYDIVELKSLCEQYLIANITVKNVINLLDVAIEFKADKLRKHIIYYIKFYFKELIKLEEFQKLPQICLNEITKVLQECKVENESEIDVSTKFT